MNAEFESLKRKYLQLISEAESNLAGLKSKLAVLEELEFEQRQLKLNVNSSKFAGKKLTEAVLSAFEDFNGSGITSGALRQHLLAHGFKPEGKNLPTSLYITLNRLAKAGKIVAMPPREDGLRAFRKK